MVQLRCRKPYFEFLRSLTGLEVDYVGYYYRQPGGQTPMDLYEVYTGQRLEIWPQATLEMALAEAQLEQLTVVPITQRTEFFRAAIAAHILRQLESSISTRPEFLRSRLRKVLSHLAGPDKKQCFYGYLVVNRLLASLCGLPVVSDRLLTVPQLDCPTILSSSPGPKSTALLAGAPPLSQALEVFGSLFESKPAFRKWFQGRAGVESAPELGSSLPFPVSFIGEEQETPSPAPAPPPSPATSTPSAPDLQALRHNLEAVVSSLEQGQPALIYLSNLIHHLNSLLVAAQLPVLSLPARLESGAYGALVHIGPGLLEPETLTVRLEMDGVHILPGKGGSDLSHLSVQTLKALLVYLDSLLEVDSRYIGLQMSVNRELALRDIGQTK